jgi:hypothetical protein
MTCGPASPGTPSLPWPPSWRRCGPGPAAPSATPPASRCASWDGARSSPGAQPGRLDELIVPRVRAHAPGLLALYGIGAHTAALLLIAAGDHPGRLRSEAAWAHLCAAAPIPASSGKTVRHRLNPGGDRQASHAASPFVISNAVSDTWLSTGIHPLRGPAEYERLANWLAGGGQRARPTSSGAISPLSCLKDRPALQEVSVSRPAAGANHLRSREPGVVQPSHGWGAAVGRCVCRAGWPLGRLLPQAAVFWATGSRGAPEWTAASEMALLGPQDFRGL